MERKMEEEANKWIGRREGTLTPPEMGDQIRLNAPLSSLLPAALSSAQTKRRTGAIGRKRKRESFYRQGGKQTGERRGRKKKKPFGLIDAGERRRKSNMSLFHPVPRSPLEDARMREMLREGAAAI